VAAYLTVSLDLLTPTHLDVVGELQRLLVIRPSKPEPWLGDQGEATRSQASHPTHPKRQDDCECFGGGMDVNEVTLQPNTCKLLTSKE
jgi:hypothetical protein